MINQINESFQKYINVLKDTDMEVTQNNYILKQFNVLNDVIEDIDIEDIDYKDNLNFLIYGMKEILKLLEKENGCQIRDHLQRMGIPFTEEELSLSKIAGMIVGRLSSYRKENKLTQKQMGKQLGMSKNVISKIENGKYIPTIEHLNHIAYALDGTLDIDFNLPIDDPYKELIEEFKKGYENEENK